MNKTYPIYLILSIFACSMLFSCNEDASETSEELSASTAISGFSLKSNDDVMDNLDSVFFTIDLDKAEIYNADSLPKGTDVTKLLVSITYPAASSASFEVVGGKVMKDTTFLYNSEDSIDFSGDVKFTLVSQDLRAKRTYSIKVNVHEVEPDSLYWGKVARRDIPSISLNPIAQKTVQMGDVFYCIVKQTKSYVISSTTDVARNRWEKTEITLPFTPDLNTFSATDDALYILDENKALYTSVDGKEWTACGTTVYSIIGSYEDRLLTVVKDGDVYKHSEYPLPQGYVQVEVDKNFPVSGVSQMVSIVSDWAVSEQRLLLGGVTSLGSYTGATWGFDGMSWGLLSRNALPGIKNTTLVSYYYTSLSNNNLTSYCYPTLLAMGGTMEDGYTLNDRVYMSTDNGLTWKVANSTLQLPDYIEDFTNAQAFVVNSTLVDARSNDVTGWIEMPVTKMPASYRPQSRATVAVTEWECPYVYLFGGTNTNGVLYNNIWRGVINRLEFKPLY